MALGRGMSIVCSASSLAFGVWRFSKTDEGRVAFGLEPDVILA